MPETRNVIDKLRLTYEGLFSVPELYKLLENWFHEKGYDKRETKNMEKVTSEGKYIELVLQPWKKITDYAKIVMTVRIIMTDVKEVIVEKAGVKVKLNQGKVQFVFDGQLQTRPEIDNCVFLGIGWFLCKQPSKQLASVIIGKVFLQVLRAK